LEDSALEAHEGWEGPDGRQILGGQAKRAHNMALYGAPTRYLRGETHKIGRFAFVDNLWVADRIKERDRAWVPSTAKETHAALGRSRAHRFVARDAKFFKQSQVKKSRQQSCRRQIPRPLTDLGPGYTPFAQYFETTGVDGALQSNFQSSPARTTLRVGCTVWKTPGASPGIAPPVRLRST
jgi:hypothetical protein